MRTRLNTVPLTFRATAVFITETNELARFAGISRSDYIRQAVEEKNARLLAKRMAFLSERLSAEHLAISDALDGVAGDGLVNC
jgi:hypothetical protein